MAVRMRRPAGWGGVGWGEGMFSFLYSLHSEGLYSTLGGWKRSRGGGGWEARGPAGVEEKNRLNVLTAALFFSSPISPKDLISF